MDGPGSRPWCTAARRSRPGRGQVHSELQTSCRWASGRLAWAVPRRGSSLGPRSGGARLLPVSQHSPHRCPLLYPQYFLLTSLGAPHGVPSGPAPWGLHPAGLSRAGRGGLSPLPQLMASLVPPPPGSFSCPDSSSAHRVLRGPQGLPPALGENFQELQAPERLSWDTQAMPEPLGA